MHDRRVARIITPGTLIDENFMDPYASNYVMAIHLPEQDHAEETPIEKDAHSNLSPTDLSSPSSPIGLAWLDLSTGQFFTQSTTLSSLGSTLSRVCPREVVLDEDLQTNRSHHVFSILAEEKHLITYTPQGDLASLSDWTPMQIGRAHV